MTTIPFPQAGWARNRIKPRQRISAWLSRLSKKKPASPSDMARLHKHFDKKGKP